MRLEHPALSGQQFHAARAESQQTLGPLRQAHHHRAIHVLRRERDGGKAERQLNPQQPQQQNVAEFRSGANALIAETTHQQHRQTNQGNDARNAATDHRQQLFGARADEPFIQEVRSQHAKRMAEEQE